VITLVQSLIPSLEESNLIKEVPIFLPENCPNSVTRLIVAQIYADVVLVVLCGEEPTLETIENEGLNMVKESEAHQENFRKVSLLKNGSSLPINDQIQGLILIKDDFKILMRYGNFDEQKLKEILIMIETGANQPVDDVSNQSCEAYLKFHRSTGYRIVHHHHLYALFPSALALNEVKNISHKTMSIFKEKKVWPHA
jgi:hypothetical protein